MVIDSKLKCWMKQSWGREFPWEQELIYKSSRTFVSSARSPDLCSIHLVVAAKLANQNEGPRGKLCDCVSLTRDKPSFMPEYQGMKINVNFTISWALMCPHFKTKINPHLSLTPSQPIQSHHGRPNGHRYRSALPRHSPQDSVHANALERDSRPLHRRLDHHRHKRARGGQRGGSEW